MKKKNLILMMKKKKMMSNLNLPINKYVIIGSYPLQIRYCKDIDVICYEKDITVEWIKKDDYCGVFKWNGKKIEVLLADNQESFQQILNNHNINENAYNYELLSLKAGHLHLKCKNQENWEKHIHDYHFLKRICNETSAILGTTSNIDEEIYYLTNLHRKSTKERINQKTPKLIGVSKETFFNDKVKKYIDHDLIHFEVAYEDKPAYSYMQKDNTVTCHKDLWDKMTFQQQLNCVIEEASVIAIERHILPYKIDNEMTKPLFLAYRWALYRICTTLCSDWFRDFAQNNYYLALNAFNEEKLNNNINNILNKINNEQ